MKIMWQVTAAVIDIKESGQSVTFRKISLCRNKGAMQIIHEENEKDTETAMSRPTILIITGDGVSSKPVTGSDPAIARIMKSPDLYVSVHTDRKSGPTVDFIRKDSISGSISPLEQKCTLIIGISVIKSKEDMGSMITESCTQRLTFRNLHKDIPLLSCLCGQLYRRLRLPVLAAYLCALAANWLIFNNINDKIQQKRIEHAAILRNREAAAASDSRQRELERRFTGINEIAVTSIAGKIAASVPDDARLDRMSISAGDGKTHAPESHTSVSVSGETFNPGSIVEMAALLTGTAGFAQADISSIGTESRNGKMLEFEIDIRL